MTSILANRAGNNQKNKLKDQTKARRALDTLDEKLEEGVISDERYKLRAEQHNEALARTTEQLNKTNSNTERLELSEEVFSGAVNLAEVFAEANDEEKRRMMSIIGANWKLGNKKVALIVREPLQFLQGTSSDTV